MPEDVRLVDGDGLCSGTLEVKYQGEWRPFSLMRKEQMMQNTEVVCRQLGCGAAISVTDKNHNVQRPAWNVYLNCDGSESGLKDCRTLDSSRKVQGDDNSTSVLQVECSGIYSFGYL